jgi:hypothetical protein
MTSHCSARLVAKLQIAAESSSWCEDANSGELKSVIGFTRSDISRFRLLPVPAALTDLG